VAGQIGAPFLAGYVASKHALEGLSLSLRRELMLFGIDVIVICARGHARARRPALSTLSTAFAAAIACDLWGAGCRAGRRRHARAPRPRRQSLPGASHYKARARGLSGAAYGCARRPAPGCR